MKLPSFFTGLFVLALSALHSAADPFTLLHSVANYSNATFSYPEGKTPGPLVQGSDGAFYGLTRTGGAADSGIFYQMQSDGSVAPLYSFTGGTDGRYPTGSLTDTGSGVLVGATPSGGTDPTVANATSYSGTLFQITSAGALTTLYRFTDPSTTNTINGDGATPNGGLVRGTDTADGSKVLFGTTTTGGLHGNGTVFRVSTDGTSDGTTLTSLYHFSNQSNTVGGVPCSLIRISETLFFGMTTRAGASGDGAFFKMVTDGTAGGTTLTALFGFGGTDHMNEVISLVRGSDTAGGSKVFYGVSASGGSHGIGAVFQLTTDGTAGGTTFSVRHAFGASGEAGSDPEGAITVDGSENLYGVTSRTGAQSSGNPTIYRISAGGTFTSVHSLTNGEGFSPNTLVLAADGKLYGTCAGGGTSGFGTSFQVDPAGITDDGSGGGGGNGTLAINQTIVSDSDPAAGKVARAGETVTYRYNFSAAGADAKSLYVVALLPKYIHSDSAARIVAHVNSNILTVYGGKTDQIKIGATIVGDGLVLPGLPVVTSVLDATRFTINAPAKKNALISCLVRYGSDQYQMDPADLSNISPGGEVINVDQLLNGGTQWTLPNGDAVPPLDSHGYANKAVRWTVGDLGAGLGNFVVMQLKLPAAVRLDSQVVQNSIFEVYSSTGTPAAVAGRASGDGPLSYDVRGPIRISTFVETSPATPGGLYSIDFFVENTSNVVQTNAVAVIDIPNNTRFDSNYPDVDTKGHLRSGVSALYYGHTALAPYPRPPAGFAFVRVQPGGANPDQICLLLGALRPKAETMFRVTFQAQWVNPSNVPKVQTAGYGAAFLNAAGNALFASYLRAPSTHNFLSFLSDSSNHTAVSLSESGLFSVPVSGTLAEAPNLHLTKHLVNAPGDREINAQGDVVNTVQAGDLVTFSLLAENRGDAEADDVFIQDAFLEHSSYVANTAVITSTTASSRASHLKVIPEVVQGGSGPHPGLHLQFTGLHLAGHDSLTLQYTTRIDSGTAAPVVGTLLDPAVATATDDDGVLREATSSIGSSSQPETPLGFYVNDPVQVTGVVQFSPPEIRRMVPRPHATTDAVATAAALKDFYGRTRTRTDLYPSSDFPLTDPADLKSFYPGVERFYIHYENQGVAVAKAKLEVPIPAHTIFYRASFVTLAANQDRTARGNLPGTLAVLPRGATIANPTATSNQVTFNFAALAHGAVGDVIVEVVIDPAAVQPTGSFIGVESDLPVKMSDAAGHQVTSRFPLTRLASLQDPPGRSAVKALYGTPVLAGDPPADVPDIGMLKILPQVVATGGEYTATYIIFNYNNTASPAVEFHLRNATNAVSEQVNYTTLYGGTIVTTNEECVLHWDSLPAHTAVAASATMSCTAEFQGIIGDDTSYANVPFLGSVNAGVFQPKVGGHVIGPKTAALISANISGVPLHSFTVDGYPVQIVDLGGGSAVAHSDSLEVGGGETLAQWGGRTVVDGSSGGIAVGGTTAENLLAHYSDGATLSTVHAVPAQVVVPEGCLLKLPANAVGILANGGLLATGADGIVAQGGGNIVAQGGGNIVAQGGGNIVAQGGGNIVAQGGGNIVAQGGGNATPPGATIVAQGGGNIVAQGGGNIVAQGGGNAVASPSVSGGGAQLVNTNGSNIVAQGGGNYGPTR